MCQPPASVAVFRCDIYYRHRGYASRKPANAADVQATVLPDLASSPNNTNDSLYIQDTWKVLTNFTLNLGVRNETQKVGARDGSTAINLKHNFAPRLGAIWDVANNGRSKLYANYGRFFEAIPMDINLRSFGGEIGLQSNNLDPTPGHITPGTVGTAGRRRWCSRRH